MSPVPKYPVIAISPGNSFLVINDPIVQCSAHAWQNGYFNDLVFFDSAGLLWPTHASIKKPLRFYDRFRRAIPVNLTYGQPTAGAQAQAVALLEVLIEEDNTDLYDQFISHSELSALFRAAQNPTELISAATSLGADVAADSDSETS